MLLPLKKENKGNHLFVVFLKKVKADIALHGNPILLLIFSIKALISAFGK